MKNYGNKENLKINDSGIVGLLKAGNPNCAVAALHPLPERAEQLFYRLAVALLTVSVLAVHWAIPHIKTAYVMLVRWFEQQLTQLR